MTLGEMFQTKTGKIVTGAVVTGGIVYGVTQYEKAQEDKRIKATEDEYAKKYAFSNNCNIMKSVLKNASLELAQLNTESGGNAGAVRIRNRKKNALTKRIEAIKAYIPNLDCTQVPSEQLPQGQQSAVSSNIGKYALIGGGALVTILLIANLVKK